MALEDTMAGKNAKVIKMKDHAKGKAGHGGGASYDVVAQFNEAYDIAEEYSSALSQQIFNKQWVGKPVNDETLGDVVDFFHSKEVAEMMKKALGAKGADLSDAEILDKYGLPKHAIQEVLSNYESITPQLLLTLSEQLTARIHGELVSHHPSSIANLAYTDLDAARETIRGLYKAAGGEPFAANVEKEIADLKTPDKMLEHMTQLYQSRNLVQKRQQDSDRLKKAAGYDAGAEYKEAA